MTPPAAEGSAGRAEDAARRSWKIVWSSVAGAAGHAAGILVGLALVPVVIGRLGPERFGAWAALASVVACLRALDLGIGNGLTNALAAAAGTGDVDAARKWLASAAATLAGVTLVVVGLLGVSWPLVDWPAAFKVTSGAAVGEIGLAVGLSFLLFLGEIPLNALERVFGAVGEGIAWNVWLVAGHVAGFAGAVAVLRAGGGLVALVGAVSGLRLLALLLGAVWLFGFRRRELRPKARDVERGRIGELLRTGRLFFVLQTAALVLFNTDNLVIARVLGSESVTPYSVAWRLFMIPPAAMAVVFPYLWPAYVAALARGERAWVARTVKLSVGGSAALSLALAVPLVLLGRPIIATWAGPQAVPDLAVLAWMAAWSVILSFMTAVSCFLNAAGKLAVQALFGALGAAANLALTIWWTYAFGIAGAIAATVVSYAVVVMGPSLVAARQTLRAVGSPAHEGG